MANWLVVWYKDRKKYLKRFPGDRPRESGAIDFGKKLARSGIPVADIHVISGTHAFPPPLKLRKPPEEGMLWCPYCLKWRNFKELAIRRDGMTGPSLWRCPICTISIHDAFIKRYNPVMVIRLEGTRKPRLPSEKAIRQKGRRR